MLSLALIWMPWSHHLVRSLNTHWTCLPLSKNVQSHLKLRCLGLTERWQNTKLWWDAMRRNGLNISYHHAGQPTRTQETGTMWSLIPRRKWYWQSRLLNVQKTPKKLHTLISNLTTKPDPTPWPDHKDKESLANEFTDHFQDKILQIRKQFEGIPPHEEPTDYSVPQLREFAPMTAKEVALIIKQMKTNPVSWMTYPQTSSNKCYYGWLSLLLR